MTRDELESYSYLWDGTEAWTLHVTHYSEADVEIIFTAGRPSLREILAVRKLIPKYRHMPMQQVKAQIGASSLLPVGRMSSSDLWPFREHAKALGLTIVETDASHTSYLPIQEGDFGAALLIEDSALAERIARKMLEAGVPITGITEVD